MISRREHWLAAAAALVALALSTAAGVRIAQMGPLPDSVVLFWQEVGKPLATLLMACVVMPVLVLLARLNHQSGWVTPRGELENLLQLKRLGVLMRRAKRIHDRTARDKLTYRPTAASEPVTAEREDGLERLLQMKRLRVWS